jgi:2-oxoglutarate-Fe(II)-dependent oxygenase superfamily protein
MSIDLTGEYQKILEGKVSLPGRVEHWQTSYRSAKPFSHVVIDDLFDQRTLDALLAEMSRMGADRWSTLDLDPRERTLRMRSAMALGDAGEHFLRIVHSAAFLYLLSEITGIAQLLPDPYLLGSGYAQMRRGDYFGVHSDRNVAYETGLLRRLAMIVFLNKSWSKDYHGELELWSHDGKHCDVTIEPLYNRTAIFEVANPNFHGVPTPLACPQDRLRQSFIVYFHTAIVKEQEPIKAHTSIFAPRLYGSNRMTVKSLVRDLTPPLVLRAARKLMKLGE